MATLDLRPLSLGELLDRTFFLYRSHFVLFVGIAALPYSIFLVVNLGATLVPVYLRTAGPGGPSGAGMAAMAFGGLFALVALIVGSIAFLYSLGATVFAVSEIYLGRRTSIRDSLARVGGHAGTVFGVLFLSGLIMMAGFIALIIPGIYLMCRIAVATPAALLEDIHASGSISRSFALTKGFAGRAFMIYLLSIMLIWGAMALLQFPFMIMMGVNAKQVQLVALWTVLAQVGSFIGSVLVAPVSTIGFALFYYDLRVRKEAFDLQLMMRTIGGETAPAAGAVPSAFGSDAS